MVSSGERTGVMVIRLWLETAAENALRARVIVVPDVESREAEDEVASSVDEIVEIVRQFASSFAGD
jgi:hypothetical protein